MRRFTTETYSTEVDADLSAAEVYVTFTQDDTILTLSGDAVTVETVDGKSTVSVTLTPEQTAGFEAGKYVLAQVNWILDGVRKATDIEKIRVQRNLLEENIEP